MSLFCIVRFSRSRLCAFCLALSSVELQLQLYSFTLAAGVQALRFILLVPRLDACPSRWVVEISASTQLVFLSAFRILYLSAISSTTGCRWASKDPRLRLTVAARPPYVGAPHHLHAIAVAAATLLCIRRTAAIETIATFGRNCDFHLIAFHNCSDTVSPCSSSNIHSCDNFDRLETLYHHLTSD